MGAPSEAKGISHAPSICGDRHAAALRASGNGRNGKRRKDRDETATDHPGDEVDLATQKELGLVSVGGGGCSATPFGRCALRLPSSLSPHRRGRPSERRAE